MNLAQCLFCAVYIWTALSVTLDKGPYMARNTVQVLHGISLEGQENTAFACRWMSMHGPTEQPHSRVRGQWHWVLWQLSVSNLFVYLCFSGSRHVENESVFCSMATVVDFPFIFLCSVLYTDSTQASTTVCGATPRLHPLVLVSRGLCSSTHPVRRRARLLLCLLHKRDQRVGRDGLLAGGGGE